MPRLAGLVSLFAIFLALMSLLAFLLLMSLLPFLASLMVRPVVGMLVVIVPVPAACIVGFAVARVVTPSVPAAISIAGTRIVTTLERDGARQKQQ